MKTKGKKLLRLGAGVLAGLVMLTGCGGAQPGGADGSANASAWVVTGGTHEIIWRDSFENWSKANPDQAIDTEWFANDAYKEKIRTAVGSGNPPTLIFSWGGGTLRDYVTNNKVIDITDQTSAYADKVLPSILEGGKVDGKLYAFPNVGTQPKLMYYNKELFDKAGLEFPKTWDELLKAVETFKAQGVIPIALAGASKWTSMMWLEYAFERVGGSEVFDAIKAGEQNAWSNPKAIEALTMVQDLIKAGAFGDSYGSVVADANADAALIHTGKAAMLLQGSWCYGTFLVDSPDFVKSGKLGFAPFPMVEGGKGDPTAITGNQANFWSVSATASDKQKESATNYMETLVSDDFVKAMVDGGDIPYTVGADKFFAGAEQEDFLTMGYSMVANASNFQLSWDQELPSDTSQTLLENVQQLFDLSITPQQFADNMNATIK